MKKSTRKELWNKAKKKFPKEIDEKNSFLIIISATVGSVVSVLLSKLDFNVVKPLTKIGVLDLIIYAILLCFLVLSIISFFLWIKTFLNRIGYLLTYNKKMR